MVAIYPEDQSVDIASVNSNSPSADLPRPYANVTPAPQASVRDSWAAQIRAAKLNAMRSEALALYDHPPTTLKGASEMACIAVAVYHESRGESLFGQKAVASVILQRVETPGRWGNTPCEVVISPAQFSFMTSRYGFPPITDKKAWGTAIDIAAKAMVDGPLPQLKGADHYHTVDVHPPWDKHMIVVARIGHHIFYHDPESDLPQPQNVQVASRQ